jgi:aminoglycoside 3-N-acetyltransferase
VKQIIKRIIPTRLVRAYGELRRRRVASERRARRNAAARLSASDFSSILVDLGVSQGDNLMVHSALGQFNSVDGGAQTVLAAICSAIGREGTLMVPTFPHWGMTVRNMRAFDVRNTISEMGVLTELVRRDARSKRSVHPTHPVSAIGPLAFQFTEGHERIPYAFGFHSPFFRHAMAGGKILMIGVDLNSLTAFHIYEDLIAPTPWFPIYEPEMRSFEIVSQDGASSVYRGYFHSLEIAAARNVERLRPAFEARAKLRSYLTDYSQISLLDSKAMIAACLEELRAGRSAYGDIAIPPEETRTIDNVLAALCGATRTGAGSVMFFHPAKPLNGHY